MKLAARSKTQGFVRLDQMYVPASLPHKVNKTVHMSYSLPLELLVLPGGVIWDSRHPSSVLLGVATYHRVMISPSAAPAALSCTVLSHSSSGPVLRAFNLYNISVVHTLFRPLRS